MAYDDYSDDYSSDSGSGDSLSAIAGAVGQLGSAVIYATGPANSGLATNPQPVYNSSGQLVNPSTGLPYSPANPPASSGSTTTLLFVGIAALVAYLAFVKM
jgi:hypothetical protein